MINFWNNNSVGTWFMSGTNSVKDFVASTWAWQQQMKDKADAKAKQESVAKSKTLMQSWLNAWDENLKQKYMSACNMETLAWAITRYAESKGNKNYSWKSANDVVSQFQTKNTNLTNVINQCLKWEIDLETATKRMNIYQSNPIATAIDIEDEEFDPSKLSNYNPEDWWFTAEDEAWASNTRAWEWGVWTAWALWVWWTAFWVNKFLNMPTKKIGEWLERLWKEWYQSVFKPTATEASYVQNLNSNRILAEEAVADAESKLASAKQSWIWIEEAEETLSKAQKDLKTASSKKAQTIADTAYEYWIWKNFANSTKEWAGEYAKAKWKQIFRDVIWPALEKSEVKVNIPNLIEEIWKDIEKIEDPTTRKWLLEELNSIKADYADPKYSNYSLKEAQNLKSDLQELLPSKSFTNEPIKAPVNNVRKRLSDKLKDVVENTLSNEINKDSLKWTMYEWKDIKTLYRDYWNLEEISKRWVKAAQSESKWLWTKIGNLAVDVTTPVQTRASNTLRKAWETFKESSTVWSALKKTASKGWSYLKWLWTSAKNFIKNPKLQADDPVGLLELYSSVIGGVEQLIMWEVWPYAQHLQDTISQLPPVAAWNAITEAYQYRDGWNNGSDNDRIKMVQAMLSEWSKEVPIDVAKRAYYDWKWDWEWKIWKWDNDLSTYKYV